MIEVHLSPRETQVLQGLANGMQMDQIGHNMGISQKTLRYYREKARRKLGAQSTMEAVANAIALGLISVNVQRIYIYLECQHALDNSM